MAEEIISIVCGCTSTVSNCWIAAIILIPYWLFSPEIWFETSDIKVNIYLKKAISIDFVLKRELSFKIWLYFDWPVLILLGRVRIRSCFWGSNSASNRIWYCVANLRCCWNIALSWRSRMAWYLRCCYSSCYHCGTSSTNCKLCWSSTSVASKVFSATCCRAGTHVSNCLSNGAYWLAKQICRYGWGKCSKTGIWLKACRIEVESQVLGISTLICLPPSPQNGRSHVDSPIELLGGCCICAALGVLELLIFYHRGELQRRVVSFFFDIRGRFLLERLVDQLLTRIDCHQGKHSQCKRQLMSPSVHHIIF